MRTQPNTSSLPDRLLYSLHGLLVISFFFISAIQICSGADYGKLIGKLSELHHGVSGEVYAVDGRTVYIKDFTYDGEAPAAYFYVGTSKNVNGNGIRLRDDHGTLQLLKRYRKKGVTLTLPEGKTLNNFKWFSVWCDEFSVNFGDVKIPRGLDYPKPQELDALSGIHGVSSEPVVVVDAQTLLIPGFSYDGEAPDAKFWVGAGPTPSPQGIRIPDENGKEKPLRRYDRKTIVLTLPGDLTVHQLGHFGVWCEAFAVDFGHTQIAQNLNVPPSLKMLGVSPQSKLNCEVLDDNLAFEVRWAVAGDSIVVQLVAKLDSNQYMSFGLSGNPERNVMVGGDVVVAWVDKQTLQGYAIDYFLDAKSQCSGGRGSCPDNRIQEGTDSVRLLNAAMVNGYSIVTYQRPLKASDELDLSISTNGSQAIIWAVGPINDRGEVSFHSNYLKTDRLFEFGRPPVWNCPMPDQEQSHSFEDNNSEKPSELVATTRRPQRPPATPAPAPKTNAWEIPPIQCYEPEDGVFYAQMGPTGGKHGYPAITGHVGWGISWYINGLLIPEINVVRGRKYTFVVEGGQNPETPARYHPFYITDDSIGGYQHKTPEEKAKIKIFAGVRRQRGTIRPTGVGRLCNWVPDQNQPPADEFNSFGAYQRTLTLECDSGEPGVVEWTPDENTPDTVYYQCFTHRYLGWKINVRDRCDTPQVAGTENHEVYVEYKVPDPMEDLHSSSSMRVSSKVIPTTDFVQHLHNSHREYNPRYPNHSKTNPSLGKLSYHMRLLTKSNNNNGNSYLDHSQLSPGSLSSSSPSSSSSLTYEDHSYMLHGSPPSYSEHSSQNAIPHRYEVLAKDTRHAHLDEETLFQHQQQESQEQQQIHAEPLTSGSTSSSSTYTGNRGQINPESDKDMQHQSSSNPQLSNILADSQPLIYGSKYVYPIPGMQILYSKTPYHYTNGHPVTHHHLHRHNPQPLQLLQSVPDQQRSQLMFIRRPIMIRRPPVQTASQLLALPTANAHSNKPMVYVERKKTIYKVPSKIMKVQQGDKYQQQFDYGIGIPMTKLMKINQNAKPQRSKIEAKVSEEPIDMADSSTMKPARNTGFDPDSIVVEGGFKPIIRNIVDPSPEILVQKRSEDILVDKSSEYFPAANFEPVFKPSPPVLNNGMKKHGNKMKNSLVQSAELRFDSMDDMEMAADSIDSSFYIVPSTTNLKSLDSSGFLIAYDGKKVKDFSLAKSVTKMQSQSNIKLASEVLARTPQFGRYKGELPSSLIGNTGSGISSSSGGGSNASGSGIGSSNNNGNNDNVSSSVISNEGTLQFDRHQPSPEELSILQNTKLGLGERSKRSAHEDHYMPSVSFNGNHSDTTGDNHENHQHHHHHHHLDQHDEQHQDSTSTLVSAGKTILANIEYVVLTVILYYFI